MALPSRTRVRSRWPRSLRPRRWGTITLTAVVSRGYDEPSPGATRPGPGRGKALLLPILVVLLTGVQGLIWTQLLPPWYGPDEPQHFDYVQILAVTGRVPSPAPARADGRDLPAEVSCSIYRLGFRSSGPFFAEPPYLPSQMTATCHDPAGRGRRPDRLTNPAGEYGPLYYALALPLWAAAAGKQVEVRLEAVRMLGVLLSVIATLCCYLAAFWAFSGRRELAAATAVVYALQPMASQQSAVVSNDALLFALAAAFFWRLFRALRVPPSAGDLALMGALCGLAFAAKPQGALLAMLVPLSLAPSLHSARWSPDALRPAVGRLVVAAVFALGIALADLAVQRWLGGTAVPGALAGSGPRGLHDYLNGLTADSFHYLYFLFVSSFWALFAWLTVGLPWFVYPAIVGVGVLAAIGLSSGLASRRLDGWAIGVAASSALVSSAGLLALEATFFRRTGQLILQGRSFLIALVPVAILLVAGLTSLAPTRWRGVAAAWICAGAASLAIVSGFSLLEALFA